MPCCFQACSLAALLGNWGWSVEGATTALGAQLAQPSWPPCPQQALGSLPAFQCPLGSAASAFSRPRSVLFALLSPWRPEFDLNKTQSRAG